MCEYIFKYNARSDDGQKTRLQNIMDIVFKFYDDVKSGVINESIWDEKRDDTHTEVYVHNSD